jgi:predicted phosphodiesterase
LPDAELVELGGVRVYVLHDLARLDLDPAAADVMAVIAGHSHRRKNRRARWVLYLNPGSARPRRFELPVAVAHLRIAAGEVAAEVVELAVQAHRFDARPDRVSPRWEPIGLADTRATSSTRATARRRA